MSSTINTTRVNSIKIYTLIARIFSIIITAIWTLVLIYYVLALALSYEYAAYYAGLFLLYIIILLVFLIPSIMATIRSGKIYNAAKRGDVQEMKANDSVAWAVAALVFTGVVPGVMLLVAHGPISELDTVARVAKPVLEEDSISKLERLKSLLDDGVISQDEFEQEKRKIFGPITQVNTPEDELRRLKKLLDSGAITNTEFEAQKKQILSKF